MIMQSSLITTNGGYIGELRDSWLETAGDRG